MRTNHSIGARWWASALVVLAMTLAGMQASAGTDARELKAREDFAAGRYQQALELFAKLYAESLHPNYLRNIGRCYQNLGEPEHAITSFRDYLRKAKSITPDERKEVEGFISEMEELKRQREASASSGAGTGTGTATTNATAPVTPIATDAPKPQPANATASVVLTLPPPSTPPPADSPPVYERWWFWAIIGGAVAIGLGGAAAAGVFTKVQDGPCPTGGGFTCR